MFSDVELGFSGRQGALQIPEISLLTCFEDNWEIFGDNCMKIRGVVCQMGPIFMVFYIRMYKLNVQITICYIPFMVEFLQYLIKKLSYQMQYAKLRRILSLKSKQDNSRRWSSIFKMLRCYQNIKKFLLRCIHVSKTVHSPSFFANRKMCTEPTFWVNNYQGSAAWKKGPTCYKTSVGHLRNIPCSSDKARSAILRKEWCLLFVDLRRWMILQA